MNESTTSLDSCGEGEKGKAVDLDPLVHDSPLITIANGNLFPAGKLIGACVVVVYSPIECR